MKKLAPAMIVALLAGSSAVLAQTTTTPTTPTTPPSTTMPSAPSTITPPPTVDTTGRMSPTATDSIMLTDEQAKGWVNKPLYSSDGKNLGEVAAFTRDGAGKVTEMHADVGGFLGIGETRVRLMPSQFALGSDRVVLSMTSEQAKTLPKIAK